MIAEIVRILYVPIALCGLLFSCSQVFAQSQVPPDDDYYEFTLPWNEPLKLPFSLPIFQKEAAGDRGYLRAQDESLVFDGGSGRAERLWGMSVFVSKDFPPENGDDAKAIVDRIASFGFNLVRIAGIDTPRYGLYETWDKTGDLKSPAMDRLDNFVAELRRAGIYYSLTINDSPLKAKDIGGIDKTKHKIREKQHKVVQLYEERVIQKTLGWYQAFFQHKNPYTNVSYALDPANIYVAAVGEDSVYDGYFWDDSAHLSEENLDYFKKKFNRYLHSKYGDTQSLKQAWGGLGWSESLEKNNIEFHLAGDLDDLEPARRRDLMQFLYQIDYQYASRIKQALEKSGYRGLYTVTNGWYGLGNQRVNDELGDFMDIHGYFDHPIRAKSGGDYHELIANTEHLAVPGKKMKRLRPFKRNFYKFFTSAQKGKPLLISEWNHSGFSDFTYEGPLLMTAYGSLQGYSGLVIHTYMSFDLGYKDNYGNRNLSGGTNPVLMSLSPSLAIAYRNGYIAEAKTTRNVVIASNESEFWDQTSLNKQNWPWGVYEPYINDGFEHKVRTSLISKSRKDLDPQEDLAEWRADTGEIIWRYADASQAMLSVNTPKFLSLAGRISQVQLSIMALDLQEPAAVTVVSLDENPIDRSSSVLVTAVSSFRNLGQVKERGVRRGRNKNLVKINKPGRAPVYMKRVTGKISLKTQRVEKPKVYGISMDGSLLEVKDVAYSNDAYGALLSFPLGTVNTPWYWVSFE